MALIDDVKILLRISNIAFDTEISDLISAAKEDLRISGVTSEKIDDDTDSLIRRAISTYVKANFGWDNPDAERLQQSFDMLKMHLTLSQEYIGYAITFIVTDGVNPLENAVVTFNGEEKITNTLGQVIFYGVPAEQNMVYIVTLDGYFRIEDEIDVSSSQTVPITLVVV